MGKDCNPNAQAKQLSLDICVGNIVRQKKEQGAGSRHSRFRKQLSEQLVLLPPDLNPVLPRDHEVFFFIKTIRSLDLSAILKKYENKGVIGRKPYDPTMMLTLILYCQSRGVKSSRGIERMCQESVPCRIITGNQIPDHDTIANYQAMHRSVYPDIFQQVLEIAYEAGLIRLEHVAVDGSKIHANASKHKAMSYERMCESVEKLSEKIKNAEQEIKNLKKQKTQRAAVDARILKQEVKFCRKKLAKVKKFKRKLERRAKDKAHEDVRKKKKLKEQGRRVLKMADPKKTKPKPNDQINFTDPESRIMGHAGPEFEQCYNAQIAVDSYNQMIVALDVVQNGNDKLLLEPMFLQVHSRLDKFPTAGSADAGYFSEEAVSRESLSHIELFVPPDRETHPKTSKPKIGRLPKNISPADKMRRKLSTKSGKEFYAQRKCIVEPVFGQVKHSVFGFDQFSWRGLENVRNEWAIVCTAHNLCKMHRALSRAPAHTMVA